MHDDHTSPRGWTTRAHSRQHVLSGALGTLAGLVGARLLPTRRAPQPAATPTVGPASGGPRPMPMTMPMPMPMADVVGEVDHVRNGFDPSQILTDFDAGEVGTLPSGQTVHTYRLVADISRLSRLGYVPRVPLDEGIADLIEELGDRPELPMGATTFRRGQKAEE